MTRVFSGQRLQQNQIAQDFRWIGLDETPWTEGQRRRFVELCGPAMDALGFPLEGRLLGKPKPVQLFFPVTSSAVALENVANPKTDFRPVGSCGLRLAAPAGARSTVRYLNVPLAGQGCFNARVHALKEGPGDAVRFSFRLVSADTDEVLAAGEETLARGDSRTWLVRGPPARGLCHVEIGASGVGDRGVAVWEIATLQSVD